MGGTKDLDKEWLVGRGSGRGETPNSGGGVDGNGDEVRSYSPKDIFSNDSNPDNFQYGTGMVMILRITTAN